jgi:hypothetical protein
MLKGLSSILKKAVQVAAPFIGAATPLGPVFGAAAGSGLASLLGGAKPKDAIISAGLAGLGGKMGLFGGSAGTKSALDSAGGDRIVDMVRRNMGNKKTGGSFLSNLKIPALTDTNVKGDRQLTGFGAALGVGLPSVLAYMGAAQDARRAQPMDPADYMSATDKFYGGQFARPPEELRIKNLNPIIQQPQGRAEGGLMGTEFAYSAYDGKPMGIQTMAEGGETFPRKTGQISGPGGPKDDKIPAMLSDGEFVFTAKAVENAGGPKAMYKMMNRLDPESERPN